MIHKSYSTVMVQPTVTIKNAESIKDRALDFTLFIILIFVLDLLSRTITALPDGTTAIVWLLIDSLSLLGLYVERDAFVRLCRRSPFAMLGVIFPMVALNIASALWSDEPLMTGRTAVELGCGFGASVYFVSRLGLRGCVAAVATAIAIEASYSLLLVVFFPNSGLMQTEYLGSWRGMFVHKNSIGQAMDIGLISVVCAVATSRASVRALSLAAFVLDLVCLGGSRSATAAASMLMVALIMFLLVRGRASGSVGGTTILCLFVVLVVGVGVTLGGFADAGLSMLGRDASFTGRTDIWKFAIESISQRPFLGYGYRAFWRGPGLNFAHDANSWQPPHAHNGYLEVALNTGIIGLVFLVMFLIVAIQRSSVFFWRGAKGLETAWPLAIIVFAIITNISEPSFEFYNSSEWFIVLIAFFIAISPQTATNVAQPDKLPN